MPPPATHTRAAQARLYLAFGCVYLFWGSTFLGIRMAVGHFPPLLITGLRFLLAAPPVFLLARLRGTSLRLVREQLLPLLLTAALLLVCSNGALVWAEQTLPSSFAALVVACIPILMTLVELLLPGGQALSAIGWTGLITGFLGLLVLLWPTLHATLTHHGAEQGRALGCLVLLAGSLCWAFGSVLSKRARFAMDPFVVSAWQMLFAGLFNVTLATSLHQWQLVDWDHSAELAILYLVVFGSIVGFGSYTYILHHAPVARVATYAYVNPIVAIALGSLVLHERLLPMEWLGTAIILTAVAVVNTAKLRPIQP